MVWGSEFSGFRVLGPKGFGALGFEGGFGVQGVRARGWCRVGN